MALAFSLCAAGPAGAAEPLGAAGAVTTQASSTPAISSKAISIQVGKTTKLKVSGGSGIEGSIAAARSAAKGATVLEGRDLTDDSLARVKKWVATIAK